VRGTLRRARERFGRFTGRNETELRNWLCRRMMETADALAPSLRETEAIARPGVPPGAETTWVARPVLPPTLHHAEALRQAVDQLPEPYRQVLLLRNRDRRPFEEVADRLGLTLTEARVVWLRAVERLIRLGDQTP
jgi:DNA-directed RNA polymerase specialized sigma24 family protein